MSKEISAQERRTDALSKRTFYKTFYVAMVITSLGMIGILGGLTIQNLTQPKISISAYHFNLQYRAGNTNAMKEVVNNSLLPILHMYDRHPTWKANLEFQAQMLEEIAFLDNLTTTNMSLTLYGGVHGGAMDLVRKLVNQGRIELIITQYSDALCVAYPYLAWYKSINYTQSILHKYGITHVSRAVLLQEGQFLFGLSRTMADFRYANGTPMYDTILGFRETASYYHVQQQAPLYTWNVSTTRGASWNSIDKFYYMPDWILPTGVGNAVLWNIWCQDGENVDTSFESTYEALNFGYSDLKLKNHEAQIETVEQQGNIFMTLGEWESYLINQGMTKPLDSFITETNWQGFSYRGAFRWMGKNGDRNTDDGQITSMLYRAFQQLQAVEIMLNYSYFKEGAISKSQYNKYYANLTLAWARLADGMVTDVTGLSPGFSESYHAFRQAGYALGNATGIKNDILNLTPSLKSTVNGSTGFQGFQVVPFNFNPLVQWNHANQSFADWSTTIVTNASKFINFTRMGTASRSDLPVTVTTVNAMNLNFSSCKIVLPSKLAAFNSSTIPYYSISLNFARDNESTNASLNQPDWQYIKFNGDFSKIDYSPTMYENETVLLNRTDYYADSQDPYGDWSGGPKSTLTDNFEIWLPLSNGLVYSENGHFAIVKNTTADHIIGKWNTDNLRFMQTDTNNRTAPVQFFVLSNVSRVQALAFANLVNTWKPVTITMANLTRVI